MSPALQDTQSLPLDLSDPEVMDQVKQRFVDDALPRIQQHAQIAFHHIRDPGRHDDAIQNTIALAWRNWLAAIKQGKDPNEFIPAISRYAVKQHRDGRKMQGYERRRDVLSPRAREARIEPHSQDQFNALNESLTGNADTPPPDQAAFREQWRRFLDDLGEKKRPIVEDMAAGETTNDLAEKYHLSAGRISNMRREAERTWRRIDGDGQER